MHQHDFTTTTSSTGPYHAPPHSLPAPIDDEDNYDPLPFVTPTEYQREEISASRQHLLLSVLDPPLTTTMTTTEAAPAAPDATDKEASPPSIPKPQSLLEEEEPSLTQDLTHETTEDNEAESSHAKRCLLDFVEWWCYKLVSATCPSDIKNSEDELLKAMDHFGTGQCDFGRLSNRVQLAAFSMDVSKLGLAASSGASSANALSSPRGGDSTASDADAAVSNMSLDQHWSMIGEELILLKSKLLRQDANADVVLLASEEERQALSKAIPDFQKESSASFQKHYKHAALLVKVQIALEVFHKKLTNQLSQQPDQQQQPSPSSPQSPADKKKAVREAIEEYESQINQLFTATANTEKGKDKDKEKDEDQDDNDNNDNNSVSSSDVRELPQELAGFLLKDLYQSSKNNKSSDDTTSETSSSSSSNNNDATKALAERLLHHVDSIIKGSGAYSQSTAKRTVRKLLKEWHDTVLEQPTLVALGYGVAGTTTPSAGSGNDTGTGSKSDSANTPQNKAIAAEDALLRRLSNAGTTGNNIDISGLQDDLSDSEAEDEDDKKKSEEEPFKKFVPVKWVDSDEESDTIWDPSQQRKEQEQQQQQQDEHNSVSSSRSTSPAPSPPPPQRKRRALSSDNNNNEKRRPRVQKLYSDSDQDPEEAAVIVLSSDSSEAGTPPPPRRREARTRSRSPTRRHDNRSSASKSASKRQRSRSPPTSSTSRGAARVKNDPEPSSTPRGRIRLSPREEEAIIAGVKQYGLNRWKIIQHHATPRGVLNKLTVHTIKAAYEQLMEDSRKRKKRQQQQQQGEEPQRKKQRTPTPKRYPKPKGTPTTSTSKRR